MRSEPRACRQVGGRGSEIGKRRGRATARCGGGKDTPACFGAGAQRISDMSCVARSPCPSGVPKMLMERPAPRDLPQELDETAKPLHALMNEHMRCQWFLARGRTKDAYNSRLKTIDLLVPAESVGIIGPVRARMDTTCGCTEDQASPQSGCQPLVLSRGSIVRKGDTDFISSNMRLKLPVVRRRRRTWCPCSGSFCHRCATSAIR